MFSFFDHTQYQRSERTHGGDRQAELLKKWHDEFIKSNPKDFVDMFIGMKNFDYTEDDITRIEYEYT